MMLAESSPAGSSAEIMSVRACGTDDSQRPLPVGGPVRGLGEFEEPLGVVGRLSDGHDGRDE